MAKKKLTITLLISLGTILLFDNSMILAQNGYPFQTEGSQTRGTIVASPTQVTDLSAKPEVQANHSEGYFSYSESVCFADSAISCGKQSWDSVPMYPYDTYAQGEYVGRSRTSHMPDYRLRVDDLLEFVYRVTREESSQPYRLNVGDEINFQSTTHPKYTSDHVILSDGTINPPLLGQPVKASRRTVTQLREELLRLYQEKKLLDEKEFDLTIIPKKTNTKLEDLRQTVNSQFASGGQTRIATVTPEGSVSLPIIGSFSVQGLTLNELAEEVNARYAAEIDGIEITPVLTARAPRYVYVVGEVQNPGRYELTGPTTVMQAISLSGSWNVGANLRQITVFRRGDDWRLLGTQLDVRDALLGKDPLPAGEIWLGDSDIVVVPKSPILLMDNFIELVFTRGIYGVLPFSTDYSFNSISGF